VALIPEPLLCTAIVQQAPEAIIFADPAGVIRLWNGGAERLFGFSAAEALGESLDLIIPERLRAPHWAGFHRAIETGRTRAAGGARITSGLHKSGRKVYVDLGFSLVLSAEGEVLGALSIGRDADARRAEQVEAAARLASLEGELARLRGSQEG
jgi:PAS domain S-box-containing protein